MSERFLDIERLCYGGAGVGRVEGKACFVHLTAPGDRVRVTVTREKKKYLEAELVEVLQPGPMRTQAPCPYFGSCGGCDWQHLKYEEQLRQKREIFAGTLARIGGVEGADVLPVLGSPVEYGYRSRIQLKVGVDGGRVRLGFHRSGTHEIIDLASGCLIADPVLNEMLAQFRWLLSRFPDCARISQVDLSLGDDGAGIAVVHCAGTADASILKFLAGERDALPSVQGLFVKDGGRTGLATVFGVDRLGYDVPAGLLDGNRALRLYFSRGGFSQVNLRQNVNLIRTVWEWGRFTGKERVLDLYCGNGNFSLPIAPYVASVVGVEGYAPSVEDARANARENGIENVRFFAEDAGQALRRFTSSGDRFDVAVLDPPRAGAQAVALLADLGPRRIIYVSCDPPTLARDLAQLVSQGYRVVRSQPVDMFPQTYHLESVTLLEKR